ncbi:inositol monophosphatase family protein [Corynebacterium halotolerans]|uniref:Inositol-1-monophosphatase n=1 Tax=Corynebacterium halotolerans YIM 70093 = DSM 44683 TaxID=1121362 RepID=M1MY42_9CORY|nr:inositol monophosphatase family protein [Corynebacterium halotolerans]AGF72649.1 inositol monophosphatase [Corynebacterium halotolerans YIM 70093 = DSM 44683]
MDYTEQPSTGVPDSAVLRDIAVDVALRAAGRVSAKRSELGDVRQFATTKSSAVDPVTVVDTMAEDFIADRLEVLRPDDGLIGEEGAERASLSGVAWVVDPIDGTVNFLYGVPQYAVSIAAAVDGEVVAGAVVNAATGAVYSAAAGHGATVERGGVRRDLRCNPVADPALALVATGFAYTSTRRQAQADLLGRVLPQVRDIRRMGAAALDLCQVAEGTVDAYYEHGIHCWDYAAGMIIAREAGVIVHAPGLSTPGVSGELTYAAAGALEPALSALLREAGAFAALPR